jgi:N6-L-threonylcarbamoyladenine synthase
MTQHCLGIESTAHTFGCGVVTFDGKILSNARDTYTTATGGMIPNDVVRHHEQVRDRVLHEALEKAGIKLEDISLITYSRGPGLTPAILAVGQKLAHELARKLSAPLVGANHSVSHLTISNLCTGAKDPVYLYVSGPNTQVIALAGKRFRIFGETLDNGLGNILDKFARDAGLGFPGGPKIEELSRKSTNYVELPYAVKGMDVSFSGILTKVQQLLKKGTPVEDLCYSLQETCFAMLAEVAERAMAHTGKKELVLIGGVAANKRLGEMLGKMCEARGAKFYAVPLQYSGDQGVMIAWQGILQFKAGEKRTPETADIAPQERTDEVEVTWA